ncbi:MAG: response regulator, partial [Prevotella sp.]|nr:response regulator [Prevotella sp.]
HGNMWIIRENSIDKVVFSEKKDSILTFGPNELGEQIKFSEAQPAVDPKSGEITLAVMGGCMSFLPDGMKKSNFCPKIVFTGVKYQGNDHVEPILNREILEVGADKRNLTIYFSSLDYSDNYQIKYAYRLEGERKWNYVGSAHSASFNRLPPGRFRLLVKGTNSDGVWMNNITALEINSHPTFWETIWAKLLYLLLFAGLAGVAIYIYRLRVRNQMERELSDMKTRFFTEISHKLRTPLTLIGGPVAEVLRKEQLTDNSRSMLEMVERNSKRMLNLVNRMLTYSREKEVYISDEGISDIVIAERGEHLHADSQSAEKQPAGHLPSFSTEEAASQDVPVLLVVEDNDDLRSFLVGILNDQYHVLQASDGQQGLEIAEREMPDFIITDVMMPVMDGLSMIHRIKQNKDICHIPIIVLSAKASLEDRLQGLREGIDDYITKPFSATYLKQRVENIIGGRRLLQQTYLAGLESAKKETYQLDAPQIVDADKKMMDALMAYLETNVGNPELRIEDLATAVHLGRTVFYGKLKSIVGMTPVDFLKHIRIQRAEQLVANSDENFSQIAYAVGFSDPKYFSKCFKKQTGMTPSDYRQRTKSS